MMIKQLFTENLFRVKGLKKKPLFFERNTMKKTFLTAKRCKIR